MLCHFLCFVSGVCPATLCVGDGGAMCVSLSLLVTREHEGLGLSRCSTRCATTRGDCNSRNLIRCGIHLTYANDDDANGGRTT